jgi:ATP-binding cassette, subfamily C, type I secretion system permease/ATPase
VLGLMSAATAPRSEFAGAISACRGAFLGIALMTGVLNVLYLTGSFFMLEIYDRVLPSRSIPTLVGLAVFALILYAFQGILDLIRGRVLVRIGASLDQDLSSRVYDVLVRLSLKTRTADGLQPLRDLDQVRAFLSGTGPTSFFDLPWMPLYLGICFLFHPCIGIAATFGALILFSLAFLTEARTRKHVKEASGFGAQRMVLAEASRRNAEVLAAMGMAGQLGMLWREVNAKYMASHQRAADAAGGLGALSKVSRVLLQSGVLGLGAYLVINQQATAGIIIASSILTSRALAPVELAIAN